MSSAVDEDTVRAVHSGRETLGAIFSSAQTHLQKVFIVFVIGFIGSFYALRIFIWDFLEATAKAEMDQYVADATSIITRTPFEVILLQAKIGMLVGVLLAIPALLYYSRGALRERGIDSVVPVSRTYLAALVLTSVTLFCIGVTYAYAVFFPFAFDFLGAVAFDAGVTPSWGITEFTEFIALLTLSFGLAAQLPLFMSVLSYTEIISYETFRDKWRHAIVGITVFGALFSPPDPFTLIMWTLPLVALYAFSLGLAKIVANVRRRGAAELDGGTALMKRRVIQFVGVLGLTTTAVSIYLNQNGLERTEELLYPLLPAGLRPSSSLELSFGLEALPAEYGLLGDVAVAGIIALGLGLVLLVGYMVNILQSPVYPREGDIRAAETPDDIDFNTLAVGDIEEVPAPVFLAMTEDEAMDYARQAMYDDNREKAQTIIDRFDTLHEQQKTADNPDDVNFEALDADEIGDLSDSVFLAMTEDDALEHSRQAMHDENRAKAEAILNRFDALEEEREEADLEDVSGETAAAGDAGDGDDDDGSLFSSTAAGMLDPFTEEETTEDDIGGYAYDLAFIVDSLTSKTIYIVGVFMAVLGGTFLAMYQGGFGIVLEQFVDRVPRDVLDEVTEEPLGTEDVTTEVLGELGLVIALHPVEVLIFMVKVSTILAIISVLPMILYWAWPAARERGLVRGDPRVFLVWGGTIFAGFGMGLFLGFYWIAPTVISYLITDASGTRWKSPIGSTASRGS